jgi:RNase P/RNase MRP subunit p29
MVGEIEEAAQRIEGGLLMQRPEHRIFERLADRIDTACSPNR